MRNANIVVIVLAALAMDLALSGCHRMDYNETVNTRQPLPPSYPADPYGARASMEKHWINVNDMAINQASFQ